MVFRSVTFGANLCLLNVKMSGGISILLAPTNANHFCYPDHSFSLSLSFPSSFSFSRTIFLCHFIYFSLSLNISSFAPCSVRAFDILIFFVLNN